MGIHDRQYYREESSGHSSISDWSMLTKLIVVTVVAYVADLFVDNSHWLMENMQASRESLTKPYLWWQLLSYGFAHDPDNVSHIFWNMFGLWIFGRQIEAVMGPREFLRFYLVAILLGGIAWTLRANMMDMGGGMLGASGAVTAVTLLFCIYYPKQTVLLMMVLPVPAWVLGAIIIGGDLLQMRMGDTRIAFDVHLVGAAWAVVYYRFGLNLGRWMPRWSVPNFGKLFQRRPKLRIHQPREVQEDFEQLEAQADDLLQKVNRDGIDSLTAKERDILNRYANRVKNRRH